MAVLVDLPLDFRVTMWLEHRYGRRSVILTLDDYILSHIRSLFTKPVPGDAPVRKGSIYYTFIVSGKMAAEGRTHISPKQVKELNEWLKEVLNEKVFEYAVTFELNGKTLKEGFLDYRKKIGLSEQEWQYETIKKAFQRRKGQNKVSVLAA